mmetsp:Transcript_7070/g.11255  ORF Transcript_7070/g.11255 Transcript_7070/m.11255 type:complete len:165 (+) Transcript_7070:49-543(+)
MTMSDSSLRTCAACAFSLAVGVLIGTRLKSSQEKRRKRKMLKAEVRPDRAALYKRHHAGVWPEVEAGLAAAGVETISIWSDPDDECKLFMYLEEAEFADDLGPGSAYRSKPRVGQWEEVMEKEFHSGWSVLKEWYSMKAVGSRSVWLSSNSLPPCYDLMNGDGK